jgi:hypothetical protein
VHKKHQVDQNSSRKTLNVFFMLPVLVEKASHGASGGCSTLSESAVWLPVTVLNSKHPIAKS